MHTWVAQLLSAQNAPQRQRLPGRPCALGAPATPAPASDFCPHLPGNSQRGGGRVAWWGAQGPAPAGLCVCVLPVFTGRRSSGFGALFGVPQARATRGELLTSFLVSYMMEGPHGAGVTNSGCRSRFFHRNRRAAGPLAAQVGAASPHWGPLGQVRPRAVAPPCGMSVGVMSHLSGEGLRQMALLSPPTS